MTRISTSRVVLTCAIFIASFFHHATSVAQNAKSTGRFMREGVIAAITSENITITHDDGQEIDYSTDALHNSPNGKVTVTGRLPMSFVAPGMVLSATVRMSPMGKVQQTVDELAYVNDQSQELEVERTDESGVCKVVGRVMRLTGQGMLLKVSASKLVRTGRVELTLAPETEIVFDMQTLDVVSAGDTVQSMMGVTYEGDLNVISNISIELSPNRKPKAKAVSTADKLLEKYAYLSDENRTEPKIVKLENFTCKTDISPLQTKVLGMKLEAMHEAVCRYYKKHPKKSIGVEIIADINNWSSEPPSANGKRAFNDKSGFATGSPTMMGMVASCDDHDTVVRTAFDAYIKTTFKTTGPKWYSDGMALVANYWAIEDKSVRVPAEFVAHLKSSSPVPVSSIVANSSVNRNSNSEDLWKNKAASWALCYMMIHNANYKKEFRALGLDLMQGGTETFETRFADQMPQINFEYRQFLKNLEIGYREDLCEWHWKVKPKKLFGSDMIDTNVDSRAGWQATKVELVAGQTYEFVAQGEWQTNPECESSTASGLNGGGRLLGTIFNDYQLTQAIPMGDRGAFVADTDGQLFLRCEDKWNEIEDNKGRLKVFIRKAQ